MHRLRKKKYNSGKPRLIIARFISYKKRNEFLFTRSNNEQDQLAFRVKDLTQGRQKLLNYVKKKCEGKFVLCHSYNGRKRTKKLTQFHRKTDGNEKGDGVEEWININSPNDLFKRDIDVDFTKLDYKPLLIDNCDDVQ